MTKSAVGPTSAGGKNAVSSAGYSPTDDQNILEEEVSIQDLPLPEGTERESRLRLRPQRGGCRRPYSPARSGGGEDGDGGIDKADNSDWEEYGCASTPLLASGGVSRGGEVGSGAGAARQQLEEDAKWWSDVLPDGGRGGEEDIEGENYYNLIDTQMPPPVVPIARPVPSAPEDTLSVVVPLGLEHGYSFVATLEDGRPFTVSVDGPDGASAGDILEVTYPTEFLATTAVPPTGHWKDGLCACCRFGCCHPMLCLPWCCSLGE